MRSWQTFFVGALATLWVAASFHCRLEIITGFEFLSCCQHSESEKSPGHHEKECNEDGCAAVENGFCKLERSQNAPVIPLLALVPFLHPSPGQNPLSASAPVVSFSSVPPDLPRVWQFSQRKALPPRAPSFVS